MNKNYKLEDKRNFESDEFMKYMFKMWYSYKWDFENYIKKILKNLDS